MRIWKGTERTHNEMTNGKSVLNKMDAIGALGDMAAIA